LSVEVEKSCVQRNTLTKYQETPIEEVSYEVRVSPPAKGIIFFPLGYSFATVIGAAPIVDLIQVCRGLPDKTMAHGVLYLNDFTNPSMIDSIENGVKTKGREISRKSVSSERVEVEKYEETKPIERMSANNIPVKLHVEYPIFNGSNEQIKSTDSYGKVQFNLEGKQPGKFTLETIAADGMNDRKEF
jgi:hypothetical protein